MRPNVLCRASGYVPFLLPARRLLPRRAVRCRRRCSAIRRSASPTGAASPAWCARWVAAEGDRRAADRRLPARPDRTARRCWSIRTTARPGRGSPACSRSARRAAAEGREGPLLPRLEDVAGLAEGLVAILVSGSSPTRRPQPRSPCSRDIFGERAYLALSAASPPARRACASHALDRHGRGAAACAPSRPAMSSITRQTAHRCRMW